MKYIIGNWKMYPRQIEDANEIVKEIKKVAKKAVACGVQPVICPPAVFLAGLIPKVRGALQFGAQNSSEFADGPHTGELSTIQFASLGAQYIILGHSECRGRGETDALIAAKVITAVKVGMHVILCVGEKERDHNGEYFGEVAAQLRASLENFPPEKTGRLLIAYEPLWAIGEKATHPASARDFQEMAMLLRRTLSECFDKTKAFKIPLLYGGSIDAKNAQSYLDIGADGLLVGRASLKVKDFVSIIDRASGGLTK